jgi:hypothetical protein
MVYGFEITGDSKWYVTDNWMVTHNSTLGYKICKKVNNYMRKIARECPEYAGMYKFNLEKQMKYPKKYKYFLYKRDDVINFLNKWNSIAVVDEAVNVAFNREFYNDDQKNLIKLINMNRDHLNLCIMCVPQFQVLDNQVKNLCKIRLSVVRRGLAIIQTPNQIIYGRDKWDSANNEKIEREWQMGATKRPRYTKLTTFRGLIRFNQLTDEEERIYQAIKNSERNLIRSELGVNDIDEQDVDEMITERLIKGGVKNMQLIEGVALANGLTLEQLRGKIRRRLGVLGVNTSISSYLTDKKAKDVDEEFSKLVKDVNEVV